MSLILQLIPYDYYYESFHFCRPEDGVKSQSESLGSILFGDRLYSSAFEVSFCSYSQLNMLVNSTCKVLCQTSVPGADAAFMNERIRDKYVFNWMVDGLPASQKSQSQTATPGFRMGQRVLNSDEKDDISLLLNNHYEIYVMYHTKDSIKHRVVGVSVNPSSTASKDCKRDSKDSGMILSETGSNAVTYTYDVYWIPSKIPWGSRWDVYLYSSDTKIHWFSVINSVIVAVLLSAIVIGILLRALRKDIIRYNEIEFEDSPEEFGWKMVHGDVFRSPSNRMILSVFVGNGSQILFMAAVTIGIAILGFLSPSNRGSLVTVMVVFYGLFSSVAGYVSARIYKMCGGQAWKQNVLMTAMLVPGVIFVLLLLVNFLFIIQNSSSAVPFGMIDTIDC
jgi:transmembrane 9 superfamily protein 2/4